MNQIYPYRHGETIGADRQIRRSLRKIILSLLVLGSVLVSSVAHAVPIGYLSFDVFIPGPGGTNAFFVNNLTGDSAAGGFALPPTFPVIDPLILTGSSLTLTLEDGSTQVISMVDQNPGPISSPPFELQFSDTMNFLSATFTASLNQTTFLLSNGNTFVAASPLISVTLLPSSGPFLIAGLDFGVIDVAPQGGAAVPEPATLLLMGSGSVGLLIWKRKKTADT